MNPTHIILHHSLTRDSGTVSWGAIRDYHENVLGYKAIGYEWGIERVGDHYESIMGRIGLPEGAHCRELGMNHHSIGICIVGNYDDEPPPEGALDLLRRLLRFLQKAHGIPTASVLGHREVGWLAGYDWRRGEYKTCPGAAWDLAAFRQTLD